LHGNRLARRALNPSKRDIQLNTTAMRRKIPNTPGLHVIIRNEGAFPALAASVTCTRALRDADSHAAVLLDADAIRHDFPALQSKKRCACISMRHRFPLCLILPSNNIKTDSDSDVSSISITPKTRIKK
jgi:hypothetical protein